MTFARFFSAFLTVFLCGLTAVPAQQTLPSSRQPAVPPTPHAIRLNVVVDTKSGRPVPNLSQQDFTVLDNKAPQPIRSFRVVTPAQEPVRVILLLDAVNTPYEMVAYMRNEVENYLKGNAGALAQPTTIAVLTDRGVQIQNQFSTDGNALSQDLDRYQIALRDIHRGSQWSDQERLQICLTAFGRLIDFAAPLPGRKIVFWISPGWPLISGPRVYLDQKEEQEIFSTIVSFSTGLRKADMTVYNINPVGVDESLVREDYYEAFLNGVSKPGDVLPGNLGLQVLAIQSGGLASESNSDVTGVIRKSLIDVGSWYEITYDAPPAEKPNEYHHIDIKLNRPDMSARTRDGYYANPTAIPSR